MKIASFIAAGVLSLSFQNSGSAQTTSPAQPPRWVSADDVRVRATPDLQGKVFGSLPRGAELILKSPEQTDGFCLIEGEGHYGYMACKYLSAERIARARAGEGGVPEDQRWVSGNGVTLREAPHKDASVVSRMPLNLVVKLLDQNAGGGYCKILPSNGLVGFTACSYLVTTPVVLAKVMGYGTNSAGYDPERAFALQPSWQALENYADVLKQRNLKKTGTNAWPRDEALERMKAHLALGIMGDKPASYPDWTELKRRATAADLSSSDEILRLMAQKKQVPRQLELREAELSKTAHELQNAIGIWGPLHDSNSRERGAERVIRLVRALELPAVTSSLFKAESELAPPHATAEAASGRFGIVFRQLVSPRPKPSANTEESSGAGLYDMLARTQVLTRAVRRVQLMRNGGLRVEPSFLRRSETLWRDVDEPMCSGSSDGFGYGDADPGIWKYFGDPGDPTRKPNAQLKSQLYAFYTNIDLPTGTAIKTEIPMKLDQDATGFIRGVSLYYDLNGDGITDMAVWEGQGKGPGHLEGPTTTDDRWYRLVLANINGTWKILGSDVFSYGCGC